VNESNNQTLFLIQLAADGGMGLTNEHHHRGIRLGIAFPDHGKTVNETRLHNLP